MVESPDFGRVELIEGTLLPCGAGAAVGQRSVAAGETPSAAGRIQLQPAHIAGAQSGSNPGPGHAARRHEPRPGPAARLLGVGRTDTREPGLLIPRRPDSCPRA